MGCHDVMCVDCVRVDGPMCCPTLAAGVSVVGMASCSVWWYSK